MSFQLSLLRGKPGRAYSKKNHQINGVDPRARWRLKYGALHDSKVASRCSSTLDRRFDQTSLVVVVSRFVVYNVAETFSCEQIGQNSNSIFSSTRALEWLAMGCPHLRQFHLGAIPLEVNFVHGTRRLQGKGYNYHNLNANSVVKPKNCHTPKS